MRLLYLYNDLKHGFEISRRYVNISLDRLWSIVKNGNRGENYEIGTPFFDTRLIIYAQA